MITPKITILKVVCIRPHHIIVAEVHYRDGTARPRPLLPFNVACRLTNIDGRQHIILFVEGLTWWVNHASLDWRRVQQVLKHLIDLGGLLHYSR